MTDCVACERIEDGLCPGCGHLHGEMICDGPAYDPFPGNESCGCDSSRDHYLMHPHRVCREDMTDWYYDREPDHWNCINAVVHGFDKCWTHLTAREAEKLGAGQEVKSPVKVSSPALSNHPSA